MNPAKRDGNEIKEVHTGLYISHEKSEFLIEVVQGLLQENFSTKAVAGPRLPCGSCEILLQAAFNSSAGGVNFPASKDLLGRYYKMLRTARGNYVLRKTPEVVNIDDEDSFSVNRDDTMTESDSVIIVDDDLNKTNSKKGLVKSSSIEVIDIDLCEDQGLYKESPRKDREKVEEISGESNVVSGSNVTIDKYAPLEQNRSKSNAPVSDEIIIIDSVKKNNSKFKILENTEADNTSEKLCRGKKRKKRMGIIEIEDDEVIILDDSFTSPKHFKASLCLSSHQDTRNLTVTLTGDSRTILPSSSKNNFNVLDSISCKNDSSCFSQTTDSNLPKNLGSNSFFLKNNPTCSEVSESSCLSSDHNQDAKNCTLPGHSKTVLSRGTQNDLIALNPTCSEDSEKSGCQEMSAENETKLLKPVKKPSKLAYKRPAHLVSPLTQSVSGSTSAPSESFSGMSNIYNPNANVQEKRSGLRPIVIDGNNVGVSHGKGQFSVKGIQICINYFEKRGHRQIKAFIPQYRMRRDVHDILTKMERQGTVVMTPSRKVDGKTVAPYDDRYIVQYAAEVGGVIVSTDNYRDLFQENPTWRQTIQNRLLMFSWVDDLLMFPQDPMGRNGPSLERFLEFPD